MKRKVGGKYAYMSNVSQLADLMFEKRKPNRQKIVAKLVKRLTGISSRKVARAHKTWA